MNYLAALDPTPRAWLLGSVLAPHATVYGAHLERGQYSTNTITRYLGCLAHLARWMTQRGLPVRLLNESAIGQFLGKHLPRCDCPKPAVRVHGELRAACGHLLTTLREQGVIAEPSLPSSPVADELRRYDEHMRDVRGLSAGTRRGCLRFVERLLLRNFADRPIVIDELRPDDVRQFIAEQLALRETTSNAATLAAALRAYFRYRATCGNEIRAWLKLNPQLVATSPLLPNRSGQVMARSNVTQRLALTVRLATRIHPELAKRHISPHTIRHTTAMHLLQSGVDISVIALWLGHESPTTTHHYVEADLAMKERALARLHEPDAKIRRYRAPDSLLEFLTTL